MEDIYAPPRRSTANKVMDYALPAMSILEAIITGTASKGNYIGTTGLDVMSARAAQEQQREVLRQKAIERSLQVKKSQTEDADRLRTQGIEAKKEKREAAKWEQDDKDSQEKANTRKATIDRLIGIPNEYDEKTNTVTRSGVPGVPDLTPEDKASIQVDPIAWLTNRLKPQPTQLVISNDGTYQPVNRLTGLAPNGEKVTARPQVDPFGTQLMVGSGGVVTPVSKKTGLGPDGKPVVAPSGEKPPTEDMTKAANFARRMELAMGDLEEVEKAGYDRTAAEASLKASGPSATNSSLGQRYSNAEKNFATANLRKESGAVIGESEMKNQEALYFPRYKDSPETVAQKARNRAQAFAGMRSAAGKQFEAVPSMIPTKTDASPIIEELKKRAKAGDKDAQAGLKAKGIPF